MSDDTPSGSGRAILLRVAELETWREQMDAYRLGLSGVADENGRLGKMDRRIDKLREDVGDSAECRTVRETAADIRTGKRRLWAAVAFAASAVGASGWGLLKSRDENIAAAARAADRLDRIERDVERNRRDLDRLIYPHVPFTPDPTREP